MIRSLPIADEVRARRVERVGEDAGLAGQRPALVREHAGAAVRVVIEPEEVLDQVVVIAADLRGLRLVLVEPGVRLVEPVDRRVRVHLGVDDDADAGRSRPERDEPHPVARPHQVVGAQPAVAGVDAALPVGVGRPVVELERLGDAPPRGVGLVRARAAQAELALQEAAPAGGVDDPPAGDAVRCAGLREVDGVVRVAEHDVGGDGAIEDVAALALILLEQEVLEPAAIELIARRRAGSAADRARSDAPGRGSVRRRRSSGCRISAAAGRPCAGRRPSTWPK